MQKQTRAPIVHTVQTSSNLATSSTINGWSNMTKRNRIKNTRAYNHVDGSTRRELISLFLSEEITIKEAAE